MARILITGGSGLIGKELCQYLLSQNHEVRILSRNPRPISGIKCFFWNLEKEEIDEKAFEDIEHIIHLAGANIAEKRWTINRKKEIINSRIKGIPLIANVLKKKNIILKTFIGASAVGVYGMTNDRTLNEDDEGKNDFLSESCAKWEKSYEILKELTERLCVLRFGIVLSKKGGIVKKLLPLFELGLGSSIGTGKQYMPWIDIEDAVLLINWFLFNTTREGIYNAVATEQINNEQFSKEFAKAISKPFFMPNVPSYLLKMLYGEMANMLLNGSKINNQKLLSTGFQFRYSSVQESLKKKFI